MMKKAPSLTLLLLYTLCCSAQDSLLSLLPKAKEDSNKVLLLIKIGFEYEGADPRQAKVFYKAAGDLSEKINYPAGILKYIANYTYVLNMEGQYDSSIALNLRAVALARQIKDSLLLGNATFNAGTSYAERGDYELAAEYYEQGKTIFALLGRTDLSGLGEDKIQVLNSYMHQYEQGIQHGEKAVALLRQQDNRRFLGAALSNLGLNYMDGQQPDKAEKVYHEALAIAKEENDVYMELSVTLNLGDVMVQKEGDMYPYFTRALELCEQLDVPDSKALALRGLSYHYKRTRNYPRAKELAEQALQLTYEHNLRRERGSIFSQLSDLAYAMQDPIQGNRYATESTRLEDSLFNEAIAKKTVEMEHKYGAELKEAKITRLETGKALQALTIKNKNMLIFILSVLTGAVVVVGLLLYRGYRQKQKVQQLRIHELETEKQLTATEAVLKGEEQERARMAKDLHDGLGGMLSGVKFSLHSVKGNLVMTPDNAMAFERSLDMLDSSIGEMRRIAHNMLPEALIKYGLDTALHSLCQDVSSSWPIQVRYQSMGLEGPELEQRKAITVYRIVQELLNNTLKHAEARKAIVQLSRTDDQLCITVEDDGKGFDPAGDKGRGMGLDNIRNRVNFLGGKLDIDSGKGRGTSSLIEIPL